MKAMWKSNCKECGYLFLEKSKYYKCFTGDCPVKIHNAAVKKYGMGQLDSDEFYNSDE